MSKYPFLDLKKLHGSISSELNAAISGIMESNAFINGPELRTFETEWAAFCGTKHAVGCANGTLSLHAILQVMGIGKGDEVIIPSHTFIATAESVRMTGATPVFAEIDHGTMLIEPKSVEALISPRTRAVIAVHLYGMPADMDALSAVVGEQDIPTIEDAAQGHGAIYHGKRAGSLGHAASFSFFPGKNLGAFGDAGAATTNDDELASQLQLYVNHGRHTKYENIVMGTNYRMDTLQAAILLVKLRHLEKWNAARAAVVERYRDCLSQEPFVSYPVELQSVLPGVESANHLFPIRVPNRDLIMKKLKERGVATGIHYPIPCHLQKSMSDIAPPVGSLPITERAVDSLVSLPVCPTMKPDDAEAICAILEEVINEIRARNSA